MSNRKFSVIAANLTFESINRLDLMAAVSGIGRSTLIRQIIEAWLDVTVQPEAEETEVAK